MRRPTRAPCTERAGRNPQGASDSSIGWPGPGRTRDRAPPAADRGRFTRAATRCGNGMRTILGRPSPRRLTPWKPDEKTRRKKHDEKNPFHPPPRMWQSNRGGRRPSDRQSHAAVCRGSPPRPSARQRCSAREGRPRVALGPGSIAVSNESSPLGLPTHRRLRSPERAGACVLAPVPGRLSLANSSLLPEGMFRAQTGRRPAGANRSEPPSRGEWMPGPSPRPAPHAAPLDIRFANAEARSSSDGVSAISGWRDRCVFARLCCSWSCWGSR
jgi:hypothetical protein